MLTCASNLQEAFNLFDPLKALATKEEQERYFVRRPNEPLEEIKTYLQNTTGLTKMLFSGHRGSGKSTVLNRLALEMEKDFFVVKFSVIESLNIFDLSHIDVILTLALKLLQKAIEDNIQINEGILEDLSLWFIGISQGSIPGFSIKENESILPSLKNFQGKIQIEEDTRKNIRLNLEPKLSELIKKIDLIISEIEENTEKKPLTIIDGFDKINLNKAHELFYGYSQSLLVPHLAIIYTFPIALRYSSIFQQIVQSFPIHFILPNVTLNKEGKRMLKEVILRRMDEKCMKEGVIEKVSGLNGGGNGKKGLTGFQLNPLLH